MSNIKSYGVYEVIRSRWIPEKGQYVREVQRNLNLPAITIFGPNQSHDLEFLKTHLPKSMKIIFEGKKAINSRAGHQFPKQRNTIVVIDKA
jgi:hypothetical protein